MAQNLTGLAKRLVNDNLVNEAQALEATHGSAQQAGSFIDHVLRNNNVSDLGVAQAAAAEFSLPLFDINALEQSCKPQEAVTERLIRLHQVLPILKLERRLILATSDPGKLAALQEIGFHTGLHCEFVVVLHGQLQRAIQEQLAENDDDFSGQSESATETDPIPEIPAKETARVEQLPSTETEPIIRFVDNLFQDAVRDRASDIHIELYENLYRIRFRIDGVLHTVKRPPLDIANRVVSRIKVLAKLDIAEKRLPQDGHISIKNAQQRSVHFRASSIPTSWGEKIVLRLLDSDAANIGIDVLGYDPWQKAQILQAIAMKQGMILLTGPTGSGKTTSLYSALSHLNSPEKNIVTIEDPVEINLEGINQISVHARIGLTFASALRAVLRQDPDVVMIGEIRDSETAEIAVKAAQTGHLVLSTLHTNSAVEALSRLRFMGLPDYNLATAMHLIIAQRLARRLCEHCKEPVALPAKLLEDEGFNALQINDLQTHQAVGCKHCREGYQGRVGIYEVVPINADLSRLIIEGGNALELADQQQSMGLHNLRQAALVKVAQGHTSLEEARRVT